MAWQLTLEKTGYLKQLAHSQIIFADYPNCQALFNLQQQVIMDLEQGKLPSIRLPQLLLPDDIQFALLSQIENATDPAKKWQELNDEVLAADLLLRNFRPFLSHNFGLWAYVSQPLIKQIHHHFRQARFLELMAGNGYFSAGMEKLGHQVQATDDLSWQQSSATGKTPLINVGGMDAVTAVKKLGSSADIIFFAWSPDHDPIDQEILLTIRELAPQPLLMIIGEPAGATNTKHFFELAEFTLPEITHSINQKMAHFDLINDEVYILR